jgi:PLP dependent protein
LAGFKEALDGAKDFRSDDFCHYWPALITLRQSSAPISLLTYDRPLLKQKIDQVESRIADAAARAGRKRSDILLVAVTKKFPAAAIQEAYALGLRDFGENYVQEFDAKRLELADCADARYHFIGHLQSNKAKKAAEIFDVIHTVDSDKLARRLNDELGTGQPLANARGSERPIQNRDREGAEALTDSPGIGVLIEVKLSTEPAKAGVAPGEVPALVEAIRGCPHLGLLGLMTMPPWSDEGERSRPYFARLRELAAQNGLEHLSMGMSHDLEVAIEEGATMVRVGTALFGPRVKAT